MHKIKSRNNKPDNIYKHILVCVTQQKNCERLINKAFEIGKPMESDIDVLHVAHENYNFLSGYSDSEALEYLFTVSKAIGANLSVIKSNNIINAIINYAKERKTDCIILGKSQDENGGNNFIRQITENLVNTDVILISST